MWLRGTIELQSCSCKVSGDDSALTDYGPAVDIWSAACILAEIVLREPMFQGPSEEKQLFTIFEVWGGPSVSDRLYYKKSVDYMFKGMIDKLPSHPKPSSAKLSKMFSCFRDRSNLIDLLEGMFKYNPSHRLTATQALKHPFFEELSSK